MAVGSELGGLRSRLHVRSEMFSWAAVRSGSPSVPSRLAGRTAIVFGGGHTGEGPHGVQGIGFACAATFAGEGANVVVVDRDGDAAQRASDAINERGGRSIAVVADVLSERKVTAAVKLAVATFERIDIVQNNIGQTLLGGPLDISLEEWRRTVAVNLDTVFLGAKATLPYLLDARGSMINISSTASIRWTGFCYPAYAAAKAAVNQLTQSMALQYARLVSGSTPSLPASSTPRWPPVSCPKGTTSRRSGPTDVRRARPAPWVRRRMSPTRPFSSPQTSPLLSRGRCCRSTTACMHE